MKLQNRIKTLSKIMEENGLEELNIDDRFLFGLFSSHAHLVKIGAGSCKAVVAAPAVAASAPTSATPSESSAAAPARGITIKSPMVGVVYLAPEPGAKKFIEPGQSIKAGDTICVIEAMKTFSPVKAEKSGVILEILAKDGQVVEFDTPLVVVE
ncbi:MAG: hypothetical protein LBB23_00030 [Rickettsiales bacterium]|jgi:acetyl-CoA carboxylase biotin carboxyl carrier protein|nr:hypothetical protein [Rickettsiales bacterium]